VQLTGKVTYPLDEILLLCLLAVRAGAEAFTDIAGLAKRSLTCCAGSALSRRHAAHDHLGDIFATLNAQAF
jgi:hypothetical protein